MVEGVQKAVVPAELVAVTCATRNAPTSAAVGVKELELALGIVVQPLGAVADATGTVAGQDAHA